ncbi:MAG: hypothetical protein GX372_03815 [Ignavibacteria bacterium]|jgi:hypothetical protein|nr:hypothetical protein [Ignavibacteria bacterium]
MKKILIIIIATFFLFSCSEEEAPPTQNLNGIWRIFLGSEYSLVSKDIEIKFLDTILSYDSLAMQIQANHDKRHIVAKYDFSKDSTFILDINITYDNDRIVGNEIRHNATSIDSIYIYGKRLRDLPEPEEEETEKDKNEEETPQKNIQRHSN